MDIAPRLVDCTLRDGGYYNNWDFNSKLVADYLQAMAALHIDFVEIGFRSLKNEGFKGGFAFSTDPFLRTLPIPDELVNKIGVMVNASELLPKQVKTKEKDTYLYNVLNTLFAPKSQSPVSLVRIACHVHEFENCLPAAAWLKEKGYLVGFNLMQIAERTPEEITLLAKKASNYVFDVLYFADSMGSLSPRDVTAIIKAFRAGWKGDLGIHTHDNMGQAVANSLRAKQDGVVWIDSTVTGMGRGPGNAQTEYIAMALESCRQSRGSLTKLFELIPNHFKALQVHYDWGTNPYYYMAGQYGIHPSYIQEMLTNSRYSYEDIMAVIEHLKTEGGKKFCPDILEAARHFYAGKPRGTWKPTDVLAGQDILILGTGPGVAAHSSAIEAYIRKAKPVVIALNTHGGIESSLINMRVACHPVRLLADVHTHMQLPQPLITPLSMLPKDVRQELEGKEVLDFGLKIETGKFECLDSHCVVPIPLVLGYALAIAVSGKANRILLAGFDGYTPGDSRNNEIERLLELFISLSGKSLLSITPSSLGAITVSSVYAL
ncbi:aldolase catalytic domain-containing protein [Synechococcus sp. AH-551-C10]|nr:aldolase catalytic domain-containing protein [Synechococcus sp. AH-551-C10]MDB4659640.1 aldolase catalytic domain-containing protein [Synechococcus sp. AH-551-C10]